MTDSVNEFLAHFGVKGMKWGRRKRADGGAVQYETTTSQFNRRSAPNGPNQRGEFGTSFQPSITRRIQERGTATQRKSERVAKKEWERETGHRTSQAEFNNNFKDPVRNDYTRKEIVAARANVKQNRKRLKDAIKNGTLNDLPIGATRIGTRGYVIAANKTRGEQVAATLLLGPVGAYLSSNTSTRVAARL